MKEKPTYEELERRVRELESEVERYRSIEERLVESESTLDCFFDTANEFMGIIEVLDNESDLRYVKLNKAAGEYVGRAPEALQGMLASQIGVSEDVRCMWIEQCRQSERTGRHTHFEYTRELPDGTHTLLASTSCMKPPFFSFVILDITDFKRAEEALKKSEEKFKKAFNSSPTAIIISTIERGEYIDVNDTFLDTFGYTREEIIGKSSPEISIWVGEGQRNELLRVLKKDGRIRNQEIQVRTKHGKEVIGSLSTEIIEIEGTKCLISTMQNITDQRRLEEQLYQAQRLESIGTLAGGIAHDFNNILSVIIGNISYILSTTDREGELHEVLSDVLKGSNQAQNLTHQLLTFAKGGKPIKKPCNINMLIEESAHFVTRGARSKCDFSLAPDVATVDIDTGQINQVIGNLIINADQAMPDGGIVSIHTENCIIGAESQVPLPEGKYVKIVIQDCGIGIHEKHLPNIFDPYFTTKQKGSGLGLAISYSIIKKHDGYISADSITGEGTTISMYLPASAEDATKNVRDVEECRHQGHGKILVMDDQETVLTVFERILSSLGYESVLAKDGAQAVALYREARERHEPFAAVILDLTVPGGVGGAKAISQLLRIDPTVKAIVSSGYSVDPVMANFEDYGFCGVIPKPLRRQHIAELLARLLGR